MKLRNIAYALLIIATICLFTSCKKECKHKKTVWIVDVEVTCTEKGFKHEECTKCHEKLAIKGIKAFGHTYNDEGICTRCGYEVELTYELNADGNSYCVTGYTGLLTEVMIPSIHKGLYVTKIDEFAFYECTNLTSVIIPNSVTTIESGAFYRCTSLTSIVIPNSVTNIGSSAFSDCTSITSITLPFIGNGNDITHFGYIFGASDYDDNHKYVPASLKEVVITGGRIIGMYAFEGCTSLTSIEIPNSVTSIEMYAFEGCTSLINIEIPNSVTSIGSSAFSDCTSLVRLEIPNSVTYVGPSAFWNCNRIEYNVYDKGKYLGNNENPYLILVKTTIISMESISIHSDAQVICPSALKYCASLTSIEIPSSVISIGDSAFSDCTGLISVKISNSVTSIGSSAFSGCTNLKSIEIPSSVRSIGDFAFYNCDKLTNVHYNGTIEDWCNISFSSFNSNPMTYASHFYMLDENNEYKEVTEIVIPETVYKIGNYQFYGFDNIKNVSIPNSVKSIGNNAFQNCTSLTSIIIPKSVTSMGYSVFVYCQNLTIYCEVPEKPSGWFGTWNSSNCKVVWGYKKNH